MTVEKYVKAVYRHLKCSSGHKKEIVKELSSEIHSSLESGETWDSIQERMGTSTELSKEYNDNMPKKELKKAKRIKIISILIIIVAFVIISASLIYLALPRAFDLKKDKSFDEQKAISKSEEVIKLINDNKYEEIFDKCSAKDFKSQIKQSDIENAKKSVKADWGKFNSFSNTYVGGMKQMFKKYVVTQVVAEYENVNVTFTISFNDEYKLEGLYMK